VITSKAAGVTNGVLPYGAVDWRTIQAQSGSTSGSWPASAADLNFSLSHPYCT